MIHRKTTIFAATLALAVVTAGTLVLVGAQQSHAKTLQERRDTIQQKIDDLRSTGKERLTERRLQACEKRQDKINDIFINGNDRSEKHLATFHKIADRVMEFYQEKGLKADDYDAAVTKVEDSYAEAQTAIDASENFVFECDKADGTHPGKALQEVVRTRHTALKSYRTAIKDLILVVKHALAQNDSTQTKEEQ